MQVVDPRQLVVISGKGGTGKTSLVACFAALAGSKVLVDCDVDVPDLHLVLEPKIKQSREFVGGKVARVDPEVCTGCGECVNSCRFEAVSLDGPGGPAAEATARVDRLACEGCGVCAEFCPSGAAELVPAVNGEWFISQTRHGPMVHACLHAAEENSGKLVSLLREEAKALARRESLELMICDAPPGIGCPVIASLAGADLALVVTEPTVSGLHDLERVLQLTRHFQIPAMVCVNRADINEAIARRIEDLTNRCGGGVVGRIPFDPAVVEAQMGRTSVVEHSDGPANAAIREVWRRIELRLDGAHHKQD